MKLAFVDNLAVGGGLSRFSLMLCRSLIESYPSLNIDYFVHFENLDKIPEINHIGERVNVMVLRSSCPPGFTEKVRQKLAKRIGAFRQEGNPVIREIEERVNQAYDLAYFPSAHMMVRPSLSIPVVGTIHDFNWKYHFGQQIFTRPFVEMMDTEILNWLSKGLTISSAQDVVDEAKKLYPGQKGYPTVVHIGPVVINQEISEERAAQVLKELNIDFPYIIFPGNFYPHKNHLNLFTAFSLLKKRPGFEKFKLVLTGGNSNQVARGIAEYRGVQVFTKNSPNTAFDVMGLGYQPNEVIDALISKANLLVSPSIYEAICTPGMDAWSFGTPTAISDIPPFREHEKAWGIRSAFFDPMDPRNMADVIETYLLNYDQARNDGKISREKMAQYPWRKVAAGYMKVFERAIGRE